MSSVTIHKIKEEDFDDYVHLCSLQYRGSELTAYDYDEDKLRWYAQMSQQDNSAYKVFIAKDENNVVIGYAIAGCCEMFFGKDIQCGILAIYVRPESRSYNAAKSLIKAVEQWGYDTGASCIDVGDMGGGVDIRYMKFLKRIGYKVKSYGCTKEFVA